MYTRIVNAIREAMKRKDNTTRDSLRLVLDKARSIQKELNPVDAPTIIPDEIMLQALQREIKQLNQTKTSLTGRKGSEIYKQTEHKIALLNMYLPRQMTPKEIDAAVHEILTNGNYPDFGSKMKAVMAQLKGKADNKLIRYVVETYK